MVLRVMIPIYRHNCPSESLGPCLCLIGLLIVVKLIRSSQMAVNVTSQMGFGPNVKPVP